MGGMLGRQGWEVEEWKNGRMEGWKAEDWRSGRMERLDGVEGRLYAVGRARGGQAWETLCGTTQSVAGGLRRGTS